MQTSSKSARVSAIVSTYNDERLLSSRLDNLLSQTIADQLEIIVINSGSSQNEEAIVSNYRKHTESIRYLRTERETLYSAWNRALDLATGTYITNANTDDRLFPDAYESLSQLLDETPEAVLAYPDAWETQSEKDILDFDPLVCRNEWRRITPPDYSHKQLLLWCYCGATPVWRRSVHLELGRFDPSYTIAGDWEFWLRLAERHPFVHCQKSLALVLRRPDSLLWSNTELLLKENTRVRQMYFAHHGDRS
jgi:glycosyltransferase involved in cell wall biosynthesis